MPQKMEYTVLDMIESAVRQAKVQPLNLGGLSGSNGGEGGPPGGFVGQLPQTKVTYDTTEAATLFTPASGMSLLDNLNHIRYRLQTVEGWNLVLEDYDGSPTISGVRRIIFSGAQITNQGYGRVLVVFSGGSGGTALTVGEYDGSPIISNVDTILFSGAVVTDLGSGDVKVSAAPQYDWFRFNNSDKTLEFGTDVGGKEVHSGKIGYESFGAGYLHIVGAGTSPNRKVKLYDLVECNLFKGGVQMPGLTSAQALGTDSGGSVVDNTTALDSRWAPFGMYGEGWVARTETWTRTGNHTFTLSGDYTNSYRKGVRVQYTDSGGVDYGVIISAVHSSGTTTVTLATNSDYAMAAGSITNTYISYQEKPRFFPDFFNFTISGAAGSGSMTVSVTATTTAEFMVSTTGMVDFRTQFTVTTGGTASTQIVVDAPVPVLTATAYPVTAAYIDTVATAIVGAGVVNGNTLLGSPNRLQIRHYDASNWGLGTSRVLQIRGNYPC